MKLFLAVTVIITSVCLTFGQNDPLPISKIRLAGTVFDANGSVVGNAEVKATDSSETEKVVKSGRDGTFELELVPGIYSLEVSQAGFLTLKYPEFMVVNATTGRVSIDFIMFPGLHHSPCGYSGADCLPERLMIEKYEIKFSPSLHRLNKDFGSTEKRTPDKRSQP
jgi:hypothetical protein